jgi:hypothetical protein
MLIEKRIVVYYAYYSNRREKKIDLNYIDFL